MKKNVDKLIYDDIVYDKENTSIMSPNFNGVRKW